MDFYALQDVMRVWFGERNSGDAVRYALGLQHSVAAKALRSKAYCEILSGFRCRRGWCWACQIIEEAKWRWELQKLASYYASISSAAMLDSHTLFVVRRLWQVPAYDGLAVYPFALGKSRLRNQAIWHARRGAVIAASSTEKPVIWESEMFWLPRRTRLLNDYKDVARVGAGRRYSVADTGLFWASFSLPDVLSAFAVFAESPVELKEDIHRVAMDSGEAAKVIAPGVRWMERKKISSSLRRILHGSESDSCDNGRLAHQEHAASLQ